MLAIRFLPDSDVEEYATACEEYEQIWRHDGEKICRSWESATSLQFKETFLNATVFRGISHSHPLSLRSNLPVANKRATLVHELGHRLLAERQNTKKFSSLENHKTLFLVLPEVLIEVGGQQLLETALAFDRGLPRPEYREAWDYALSFTPEERKAEFCKIVS